MGRILALCLLLAACAGENQNVSPQDAFLARIHAQCGKAFEGWLVTTDAADADIAAERLIMHVRSCTADEVRIPFHVGEDRSRTWVLTRAPSGLRLKHDHRHKDGASDALCFTAAIRRRREPRRGRNFLPINFRKTSF